MTASSHPSSRSSSSCTAKRSVTSELAHRLYKGQREGYLPIDKEDACVYRRYIAWLYDTVEASELTAADTIERVNRMPGADIDDYVSAIVLTLATHLAILWYNEYDLTEVYDCEAIDRYEKYLHSIPWRYIVALHEEVPQSLSSFYDVYEGTVKRDALAFIPRYIDIERLWLSGMEQFSSDDFDEDEDDDYLFDYDNDTFIDRSLAILLEAIDDMRNPCAACF